MHVNGFTWAVWAPERRRAQPGAATAPWLAQGMRCISAHPRDQEQWRHCPCGVHCQGLSESWRSRLCWGCAMEKESSGCRKQTNSDAAAARCFPLPAKGDGKPSCPFTTSKAAHSTEQQRQKWKPLKAKPRSTEIKTEGRSEEELLNNLLELVRSDMCDSSGWRAAGVDTCSSPSYALIKLPVFITVPQIKSSLLKFAVTLLCSSDWSRFSLLVGLWSAFFFFIFSFYHMFPLGKNKINNLTYSIIIIQLIFLEL